MYYSVSVMLLSGLMEQQVGGLALEWSCSWVDPPDQPDDPISIYYCSCFGNMLSVFPEYVKSLT